MTIEKNLSTVKAWLNKKARRIINESLNKGATQNEIDQLQNLVSKMLPEDLVMLYKAHNGMNDDDNMGNFFYGFDFLSLDRVADDFSSRQSEDEVIALKKADVGIDKTNILNPYWLALGFDHGHTFLRVDLAPAAEGTYGQVIFVDEEYQIAILVAKNVDELVENFSNDLDNGLYTLNEDALQDGNHYLAVNEKIDLINWFGNARWVHFAD